MAPLNIRGSTLYQIEDGEQFTCECGSVMNIGGIMLHLTSKKHTVFKGNTFPPDAVEPAVATRCIKVHVGYLLVVVAFSVAFIVYSK